jgi:XTP/dITP diphosphohydrolase
MKKITIFYATRSSYKQEELDLLCGQVRYKDPSGKEHLVGELIDFRVSDIKTDEPLEINLQEMVRHKARSAYRDLLFPCIVEHAGLILDGHAAEGYPGGLTQPMWDALSPEEFLKMISSAGDGATAQAVVGYCDGMSVRTFVGETHGRIASTPRGDRKFYWDPIFCPDDGDGLTYAEITDKPDGLKEKLAISQSARAVAKFAEFLATQTDTGLFELR